MPEQAPEQQRPAREYPFKPGKSGNATGAQRWRSRLVDLTGAFEATHHRGPSALELVSIRSAAKLAAACESPRTATTEAVRCANALHRVLVRLGLSAPPSKPKPRIPSLSELLARETAAK